MDPVVQLFVDEGDKVQQGQRLAKLEAMPYHFALEEALANQQRLQALIQNQQLTLKRYQDLVTRQVSAQDKLDKIRTDLTWFSTIGSGERGRVNEGILFIQMVPGTARNRRQSAVLNAVHQQLQAIPGIRAFAAPVPIINAANQYIQDME